MVHKHINESSIKIKYQDEATLGDSNTMNIWTHSEDLQAVAADRPKAVVVTEF